MTTQTDEQPQVGPQEDGRVGVKLANPLSKAALRRLYLPEDTPANVGHVVVVNKDQARSLIGAGYVQVNPRDPAAVRAIIKGAESSDAVAPSATSDNTVAGAGEGYDTLTGDALAKAMKDRGLPQKGTNAEKQAAVEAYDAEHPTGTVATSTDG